MFMLAVNITEHIAELLQLLHSTALAVDIAARATFNCIYPSQNTFTVCRKVMITQPGFSIFNGINGKGCGNFRTIFAMANGASIGSVAQRHAQGI